MRTAIRTAGAIVVCAAATVAGVGPAASQPEPAGVSTDGADLLAVSTRGDLLSVRVRDRGEVLAMAAGRDPADVVIGGAVATLGRVPDNPAFGFLGDAGRPVWALAAAHLPAPALDTTGVPAGSGPVVVELVGVDGPGAFHAYTLSGVGTPRPLLGSVDAPRTVELAAGTRTGAIWAFGAPGDYRLTMAVSAPLAGGRTATERVTYRVAVPGDAPPGPIAAPIGTPPPVLGQPPPPQAQPPAQAQEQAQQNGERRVFADGHVDMGPRFVDGTWTLQLRDDTVSPPAWRNLADSVLHVVDAAKITIPDGPQYGFLGEPGAQIWLLPQAQQAGIVWPGWNTQDPSVVSGVPGNVTWTVHQVDGPGTFALFLTGSFGQPQVLFDSAKPLPQRLPIPPNTHAHGNYAFSAQGVYRLRVEMSATTGPGQQVTDTRTLNIAVGPVDPTTAFGEPSGDGDDNADDSNGGGGLAFTGADVLVIAVVGLGLLAGGAVLVTVVRRTRRRDGPAA